MNDSALYGASICWQRC